MVVSSLTYRSILLSLDNVKVKFTLFSLTRSLQVPSPSNHRPYHYLTTIFLRQPQDTLLLQQISMHQSHVPYEMTTGRRSCMP